MSVPLQQNLHSLYPHPERQHHKHLYELQLQAQSIHSICNVTLHTPTITPPEIPNSNHSFNCYNLCHTQRHKLPQSCQLCRAGSKFVRTCVNR